MVDAVKWTQSHLSDLWEAGWKYRVGDGAEASGRPEIEALAGVAPSYRAAFFVPKHNIEKNNEKTEFIYF